MKSQLSLEKTINIIAFLVKFLSFVEIGQKIAFLEGFGALFGKCYEFFDFPKSAPNPSENAIFCL